MSVIGSNVLAGASGQAAEFAIERSLRFNSADSAYLSRTPSSAGNRRTFTWSGWLKKCAEDTNAVLFSSSADSSNRYVLSLYQGNFYFYSTTSGTATINVRTIGEFRDPSAWYHVVFAFDTTQATANDRTKIYVNGVQQTLTYTTQPSENVSFAVNTAAEHRIGGDAGSSEWLNGYLTEINFVDGQALAASDFGELDSNNTWQPKQVNITGPNNGTTWSNGGNDSDLAQGSWANVFNGASSSDHGTYSTVASEQGSGNSATITFSPAISGVIDVVMSAAASAGSIDGGVELSDGTTIGVSTHSGSPKLESFGSKTNITSLTLNAGTNGGCSISEIRLDGVPLIDGDSTNIGVNGFHLDVSDNSSAAALGTDSSGNSNTWTVNNLSVASGAGNDSLIDTPTNYEADSGNNGGNYPTWNPLRNSTSTFSNGNLEITTAASGYLLDSVTQFTPPGTGKWYWEFLTTALTGTDYTMVGMLPSDSSYKQGNGNIPQEVGGISVYVGYNGSVTAASGAATAGTATATFGVGDVLGWAFDAENGTVKCYKNGVAQGTQFTNVRTDVGWAFCLTDYDHTNASTHVINFGQRPFAYTPPSGYVSLCTTNLPDPGIADGSTAFDTKLWTGNATARSITGYNFSPDFAWIKDRAGTDFHSLIDIVRGGTKVVFSNTNIAEETQTGAITSFNSDGFDLGTWQAVNKNNGSFVGWAWDAGTSTVSNTDGSITSSVRANASAGFSIVSYTGNGSTNPYPTVGHGLNAVPKLIITKSRDSAASWTTYTTVIDGTLDFLSLDLTNAAGNSSLPTSPDSSIFQVGGSTNNANGDNCIAYCFAPVEGYSAFGSYTGNGSTNGPFVALSFRPAFLMFKRTDSTGTWEMYDTARDTYNPYGLLLTANTNDAENDVRSGYPADILSNGFKLRHTGAAVNANGGTYIYAAFAEHPFKTARAR